MKIENQNTISVFKTSVSSKIQVEKLKNKLDNLLNNAEWNFDLEDSENIFRVEGKANFAVLIIDFFNQENFDCKELMD